MLMSSSYTLRQVAKDLESLLPKKRTTQMRAVVKPTESPAAHPSEGETPQEDHDD